MGKVQSQQQWLAMCFDQIPASHNPVQINQYIQLFVDGTNTVAIKKTNEAYCTRLLTTLKFERIATFSVLSKTSYLNSNFLK
jgi:hypothetical protein